MWALIETNCALKIFEMFLEMSKAELHKEIREEAFRMSEKKIIGPYYTGFARHSKFLLDEASRSSCKSEKIYWIKVLYRYAIERSHTIVPRDEKQYSRFYDAITSKAFNFASQGLDADLAVYYASQIPRNLP